LNKHKIDVLQAMLIDVIYSILVLIRLITLRSVKLPKAVLNLRVKKNNNFKVKDLK